MANPFSGQLQGLGIQSADIQGEAVQDQPDTALPAGRVGRHMRRAAKKATQTSTEALLASTPAQTVHTRGSGRPDMPSAHAMRGRSHPAQTGK